MFVRVVYIGGLGVALTVNATTITEPKTILMTKCIPGNRQERRGLIGKTIKRIGVEVEYVIPHFTANITFSIKVASYIVVLIAMCRYFKTGAFGAHTVLILIVKNAIRSLRRK